MSGVRRLVATGTIAVVAAAAAIAVHAGPAAAGAYAGLNGKLAFSYQHCAGSSCQGDIAVVNPDGTGLVSLTSGSADDTEPAWSPDGSKIAFASNNLDPDLTDLNYIYSIYVMNADGTGLTLVSHDANMGRREPTWSPDGTKIAFRNVDYSDPVNFPLPWPDVWVMNANGTGLTNLTPDNPYDYDERPAWSPDGTKIAFLRGLRGDLYTMAANGSGLTSLITSNGFLDTVTWSPDGSKMVIEAFHDSSTTGTGDEVWVVNADGTGKNVIAFDGHYGSKATWSPDGTKIASTFEFSKIKVMNTDGSGRTTILDVGTGAGAADLDWQPVPDLRAGQTITFPALANVTYGAADIAPGATSTSGLPITYTTSTPTVCTIVTGKIHIVGTGQCTANADQAGNPSYKPAAQQSRSFTVNPAVITVTPLPASGPYGTIPAVSPSYTGFVYGETSAVLTSPATCSANTTVTTPPGVYNNRSSCSGAAAANYTFSYPSLGKVTIVKASVTLVTMSTSAVASAKVGRITFVTIATNAASGMPIQGLSVTVSVRINLFYSVTCTALTNFSGVATCYSGNGNLLFISYPHAYTVSTPATALYNAGSGSGVIPLT